MHFGNKFPNQMETVSFWFLNEMETFVVILDIPSGYPNWIVDGVLF